MSSRAEAVAPDAAEAILPGAPDTRREAAAWLSGLARERRLSPKTVEAYISSIFSKLALEPAATDHRRVLAVLAYLQAR